MKGWFKDSHRHSLAARGIKTSLKTKSLASSSFVKRTIDISPKPFEARGRPWKFIGDEKFVDPVTGEKYDVLRVEKEKKSEEPTWDDVRKETFILGGKSRLRHFRGDFSDVSQLGELSEESRRLLEEDVERPVEIKVGEEYTPPLESFGEKVKAFSGDFVIGLEPEADILGPEEMEKVKEDIKSGWKPIPRKESFSFVKLTGMEHLDRSDEYDRKFKMASPERILNKLEGLGVDISVPEQDVDYYVKQIEADADVKVPYVVLKGRGVVEYGNLAQLKAADAVGASGWIAVIRSKEEVEGKEFDLEVEI